MILVCVLFCVSLSVVVVVLSALTGILFLATSRFRSVTRIDSQISTELLEDFSSGLVLGRLEAARESAVSNGRANFSQMKPVGLGGIKQSEGLGHIQ